MLQPCELFNGRSLLDSQCILIYTCINTIITYNLRTIQFAVSWRKRDFDVHLKTARIVASMRTVVDGGREIRNLHLLEPLCRQTRGGDSYIKNLGDGCAYRAFILHTVAQYHIVGNDTCLTVCRACKEIEPGLASDGVWVFNGIAYCIDILV